MTAGISLRLLSVAALLAVGATTASAQNSVAATIVSPASAGWAANPTGTFVLELAAAHRTNEDKLTVSDSAGGLAATIQPAGDRKASPMTVRVPDSDMILQAYTPRGLFEIVLARQDNLIAGHWSLGENKGVVQAHVDDGMRKR
jgi:hypothetical protein